MQFHKHRRTCHKENRTEKEKFCAKNQLHPIPNSHAEIAEGVCSSMRVKRVLPDQFYRSVDEN